MGQQTKNQLGKQALLTEIQHIYTATEDLVDFLYENL